MANHNIPEDVKFNEGLRMIETTDLVHANVMNPLFEQLIQNDAFLNKLAEKLQGSLNGLTSTVTEHTSSSNNPHNINASQVGAIAKTGGEFEGIVKALSNNAYETKQIRNIVISNREPKPEEGENGDIWIKYNDEKEAN